MASSRSLRFEQAARASTGVCSAAATTLFAILVSNRYNAAAKAAASGSFPIDWTWDCIPLIGLGLSLIWNLLSFLILCTGAQFWFPRRLHLIADAVTALLLVALGYLSFVYNFISVSKNGWYGYTKLDSRMEYAGIVLLTLSCIAHFVFFCRGSRRSSRMHQQEQQQHQIQQQMQPYQQPHPGQLMIRESVEEMIFMEKKKDDVTPPAYHTIWRTENPFADDAKSSHSLPLYEIGPFDLTGLDLEKAEKKKVAMIRVVEVYDSLV